ncbi:MAG: Glutamate racemase [Candidatus Dependentiae bacterium ADurb.Bin331]|nr:MAG: Glutamate racemase [Candidatus Dependentiae bacterium ADurb.Bin331]
MKQYKKIGVFDSGLGGLTILNKLIAHYPAHYLYLADTANLPYGNKTPQQIKQFSHQIVSFFAQQEIDLCVIACHTSSAIAYDFLCNSFVKLPFLGVVDSVVRTAAKITKNNKIGVIATTASIRQHAHKNALLSLNPRFEIVEQACPQLVPALEQQERNHSHINSLLEHYLESLKQNKVDTLILGCTHYALVRTQIAHIMGPDVCIISAEDTILSTLTTDENNQPTVEFFVTSDKESFIEKSSAILDGLIVDVHEINLTMQEESVPAHLII